MLIGLTVLIISHVCISKHYIYTLNICNFCLLYFKKLEKTINQESYIQKLSFKNEDKDINQMNKNNKFAYKKATSQNTKESYSVLNQLFQSRVLAKAII